MDKGKQIDYIMDIDSYKNILQPIFEKLDSLINISYELSHVFKDRIFQGYDESVKDVDMVSIWIRDAGNTAECGWTKDMFEKIVKKNEDETVHRWLYYYDCDMLVCALCDRLKMNSSLLREFYKHFPCESPCKMEDFENVTIGVSSLDTISFACVNSVFIYLASSFDLLTKIYIELRDYNKVDFSKYPNMISRKVLFKKIEKDGAIISDTIFEKPVCITETLSIRDRIVHNGSFDFMQMVYDCYDGPNGHSEATILFPDMENGLFVTSKNRRNFYSQSNRLNILLPKLIKDVLDVMEKTITKLTTAYRPENEG